MALVRWLSFFFFFFCNPAFSLLLWQGDERWLVMRIRVNYIGSRRLLHSREISWMSYSIYRIKLHVCRDAQLEGSNNNDEVSAGEQKN